MYKKDLALNNLQCLICHKPNQTNDIDFLGHTVDDMKHIVNIFRISCSAFGLKISLTKVTAVY